MTWLPVPVDAIVANNLSLGDQATDLRLLVFGTFLTVHVRPPSSEVIILSVAVECDVITSLLSSGDHVRFVHILFSGVSTELHVSTSFLESVVDISLASHADVTASQAEAARTFSLLVVVLYITSPAAGEAIASLWVVVILGGSKP